MTQRGPLTLSPDQPVGRPKSGGDLGLPWSPRAGGCDPTGQESWREGPPSPCSCSQAWGRSPRPPPPCRLPHPSELPRRAWQDLISVYLTAGLHSLGPTGRDTPTFLSDVGGPPGCGQLPGVGSRYCESQGHSTTSGWVLNNLKRSP